MASLSAVALSTLFRWSMLLRHCSSSLRPPVLISEKREVALPLRPEMRLYLARCSHSLWRSTICSRLVAWTRRHTVTRTLPGLLDPLISKETSPFSFPFFRRSMQRSAANTATASPLAPSPRSSPGSSSTGASTGISFPDASASAILTDRRSSKWLRHHLAILTISVFRCSERRMLLMSCSASFFEFLNMTTVRDTQVLSN